MLKRFMDLAISGLALVALSPILILISTAIWLESGGPIFYKGLRIGKNGNEFHILKFRTMVVDAERLGGNSTADDDVRITKIGALLRRYKFDELPQFWNVLLGEMSVVGPRPQVASDVACYTAEEKEILDVLPGITDYASIRFHNEGELLKGRPDPDQAYIELIRPEKMRLALEYVRTQSILVDLKILWMTVMTLIGTRVKLP